MLSIWSTPARFVGVVWSMAIWLSVAAGIAALVLIGALILTVAFIH